MVSFVERMEGWPAYRALLLDRPGSLCAIARRSGNGAGYDSRQLSGYEAFFAILQRSRLAAKRSPSCRSPRAAATVATGLYRCRYGECDGADVSCRAD